MLKKLQFFLVLVIMCLFNNTYARLVLKYKNASLPEEVRMLDLLWCMTLDEKIAQMRYIHF